MKPPTNEVAQEEVDKDITENRIAMKKLGLALSTMTLMIASAASAHRITLHQPSVVGGTELKPGEYKVELADGKAVFTNGKTRVETEANVESNDSKFDINEIRVGGSKQRIVLNGNGSSAR
jgi:hypothetical protein